MTDPAVTLPEVLAGLHGELAVGERLGIDGEPAALGRLDRATRRDLLVGAGFSHDGVRLRTLPDRVASDMRLLVCGLNPSLFSADAGVGFARPGNRFWPAALGAGVASVDRDPVHALIHHGTGMTDLVKRATTRADELDRDDYVEGLGRVDRLCARFRPAAVCMVGLAGWRAAVERRATAGWQPRLLGDRPVYLMPSTSGLNAHSRLEDLTAHLRSAARGP